MSRTAAGAYDLVAKNTMEYWTSRTAIVVQGHTNCGGKVIKFLLDRGMQVIGLAPQLGQIESLRTQLDPNQRPRFHTRECDLHSLVSIKTATLWMEHTFGAAELLVYLLPQMTLENEDGGGARSAEVLFNEARKILMRHHSDSLWLLPYNLDQQDVVVDQLLNIMTEYARRHRKL